MKNNQPTLSKEFIAVLHGIYKVKWSRNPDVIGEVYEINPHERTVRLRSPKSKIKWKGTSIKFNDLICIKTK